MTGDYPALHIGDHVRDRDEPEGRMVVVGLPLQRAATYELDSDDGTTLADYNEDYPETDHVVEVIYPNQTDVFSDEQQRYAFPRSRLKRATPVHSSEDKWSALRQRLEAPDMSNDLEYLLGLVSEALDHPDDFETDAGRAEWVVAAWCQEVGYVPDLRDYDTGTTVPRGVIPTDREAAELQEAER